MKTKIALKRRAIILWVIAGLIAVGALLLPGLGFSVILLATLVAYTAFLANNKSDALPVDEPEEDPKPLVNISLRTYSDKNGY